ncbi:thiol-activated cytolysin family protein [Tenacibaculum ovolyticum]|uniref:thiol-activated cytolysin family protein n=1 Tax=Tenacibaculum ovolyticum TaxID=104270 RepID=UPI001F27570D|nr:thiol-activated cytolysin family protein [Tenacibaculum ovolyticum]
MKRYTGFKILALCLIMLVSCNEEEAFDNKSLKASKSQFLNEDIPDGISNLIIKEITQQNGSLRSEVETNCVEKEVSFDKTDSDFFLINPNGSLLWPGNVVGARSIQDGAPTSVPFYGEDRNSIEIGLDVISGTSASTSTVVQNPTPGSVRNELNRILGNYYDSGARFPAAFEVSIERVHNSSDLQFALKAGYSGSGVDVAGQLGINFSDKKTRYVVSLKQRFFTATVTPKAELIGDRGWFNTSVTPEDLTNYVTDYKDNVSNVNMNPASYIESITYGRLFSLIYESSESARDVSAALNFAYKGAIGSVNADVSTKYNQTLQNTTVKVKQIGGDAQPGITAGLSAMAGDLKAINTFLKEGANVSRTNPGYPISYKVNYVSNNSPFKVVSNVKYIQRDCELVSRKKVRFNPLTVSTNYWGYDHGTSGLELFGTLSVQKFNKATNSWYSIGSSINWGFSNEHWVRDFYKFNTTKNIWNRSKSIDFDVDQVNGERFRVVSVAGEADDSYVVQKDGGTAAIIYEYNAEKKEWTGYDSRNKLISVPKNNDGSSFEFLNAIDGYYGGEYDRISLKYNIYFLD